MAVDDSNRSLSKALAILDLDSAVEAYAAPEWLFEDREFRFDLWYAYRQCAPRLDHHFARNDRHSRGNDHLAREAKLIAGEPHWRCSRTKAGVWAHH